MNYTKDGSPKQITPVILSGGAGTRLWPLSRTLHPKQFLQLDGTGESLLTSALKRNMGTGFTAPLVICHSDHRFLVAEDLRLLNDRFNPILLEPIGRNTAPAAITASLCVALEDPKRLILLAPSDHTIADVDRYHKAVAMAAAGAEAGMLVTFGVVPTRPETGYGYVRRNSQICAPGCYWVEQFVEKPDSASAERFLADGSYLWNSGMFLFRADRMLEEAALYAPEILAACQAALVSARQDGNFTWLAHEAFTSCPAGAIDTVIMEKTDRAAVVPIEIGWNDVGSWQSLWEISSKDANGNTAAGDVVTHDAKGSFLWASGTLLAAIGVEDLVVVATADAVLICPRSRSQDVKQLVDSLRAQGRTEPDTHVMVRRPWGAYERLGQGGRFQVKRLVVNPGKRLSVQLHFHRSEHWVVVRGTARILNGDREILLFENQSTYIAAGTRHRLENPGIIPLELIEVQSGSYLGEDDIVRFDDDFGRTEYTSS